MNKIIKISAIAVTVTTLGLASLTAVASRGEHKGDGECQMGQFAQMMGKGSGGGMGSHQGYAKGFKMDRALDLSAAEVKTLVEARLIMRGNDRLKVGKVSQKNDQTFVVDIVTIDDSLVRQIEVDSNNGLRHGMNRLGK